MVQGKIKIKKKKDGRCEYSWAHLVSFPQIALATSEGKDTVRGPAHRVIPEGACLLELLTLSPAIATLPERRLMEVSLGDPLIPSTFVRM